jgi:hypothetical protein
MEPSSLRTPRPHYDMVNHAEVGQLYVSFQQLNYILFSSPLPQQEITTTYPR